MGKKKKRSQPRPKHTSKRVSNRKACNHDKELEKLRQAFVESIKYVQENRSIVDERTLEQVDLVASYFEKYDKILLLGGLGLKLIANVPNTETAFMEILYHKKNQYDEDAEFIMEYALSFATAISGNSKEIPTQKDIDFVYGKLKELKSAFTFVELCDNTPEMDNDSAIRMYDRMNFMSIRGEGYMQHIEEVYGELFSLHDSFFEEHYGCNSDCILNFIKGLDARVLSKLNTVLGAKLSHERWCEWDKKQPDDIFELMDGMVNEETVPFIAGFLKENPDLAGDGTDMNHLTLYATDDYGHSYNIFWIVPQNEAETKLLDALSLGFGDNNKFLADNQYKGHIANVTQVTEKPFVKYDGRYFCFSILLGYRNLFKIIEKLLKIDSKYYQTHFLGNEYFECRDNYMERKTKELFAFVLPDAKFYSSAKYTVSEEGGKFKDTELDVLGVDDHAVFVIEAKAHKLTDSDKRAGGKGLMDKLKDSIGYASYQCQRAKAYIQESKVPYFTCDGKTINIDKDKIEHIYKVATTFDHFSSIICDMNNLVKEGVVREEYKDTWLVSLFDLMVVVEYCQNDKEFMEYLRLREKVAEAEVYFWDELDIFAAFCQGRLENIIHQKNVVVTGLSSMFDEDYDAEALGVDFLKK